MVFYFPMDNSLTLKKSLMMCKNMLFSFIEEGVDDGNDNY